MKLKLELGTEAVIIVPETLDDVKQLHALTLLVSCGRIRTKPALKNDKGECYLLVNIDRQAAEQVKP